VSALLPFRVRPVATALAVALTLIAPSPAITQEPDLRLPISLDADSTSYDGKNSMLMFHGLRLSQGSISIQADEGRASNLDFEDSIWQFSGNVVIDVQRGHIECDSADLRFTGHELQKATIIGSPATFELQRPESGVVTYAEAGRLEYDFQAGVIEFSDDAMITEGGNTISSDYFVYDIEEQRINARSNGDGDSRVRVTYTPRDSGDADSSDEPSAEDADDADGTNDRDDEQ
jgi:lipopolysaccharide transport protein LptA